MIVQSDSDGKRLKTSRSGDDNMNLKADDEASSEKGAEQKTRTPSEPHKDYIHVRARRGQATDSHSLAERVIHWTTNLFVLILLSKIKALSGWKTLNVYHILPIFCQSMGTQNK